MYRGKWLWGKIGRKSNNRDILLEKSSLIKGKNEVQTSLEHKSTLTEIEKLKHVKSCMHIYFKWK